MKRTTAIKIRRRKNFLPALLLAALSWGLLAWLIIKFSPDNNLLIISFYLLIFIAVFLTSALILANSQMGLTISLFLITFLIFRYFKIDDPFNLILLTAIFLLLLAYFYKAKIKIDKNLKS